MLQIRSLPVRIRLTVWYLLVLLAALLLFIAGTSFVLYWHLAHQLTYFAVQDIETIEGLLYFDAHGALSMREDYHNHPQSRRMLDRLVEIVAPDGRVLYRNNRLGNAALGGRPFPGEGVDKFSERSVRLSNGTRISLVSRYYPLGGRPLLIRLGYPQDAIWSRLEEFLTAALTSLPFLLSIAALVGYGLARRSLAPLEQMAVRAEQITADHLHQRLPVGNPHDELGRLAGVINGVLNRLEQSFDQLRRFTSDASHELRTPLATIRSVGEVGLHRSKTPTEYQDAIGSMLEEVERLTRLVDSLLTLSRADAGNLPLTITSFSATDLAREVVGIVEVLAQEHAQSICLSGDENAQVKGDRLLARQALLNVLHNAVKYSPVGGRISISVTGAETLGNVTIRIQDSGPGIPMEHRRRIFERFYRVDAGRTRESGGVGLGLAIASWALQAQGGQIAVEESNEGAIFAVQLPAA